MRIRSGYSFGTAYGSLDSVASRLKEIGANFFPLTDRASCFGFNRWRHLVERPIFGVELTVLKLPANAKRPSRTYWTFVALDDLSVLYDLVGTATDKGRWPEHIKTRTPYLTYEEACAAEGCLKLAGEATIIPDLLEAEKGPGRRGEPVRLLLSPATPRGLLRAALEAGIDIVASSDPLYPRESDRELFRVALGWRSTTQSYPLHILSDAEWNTALPHVSLEVRLRALANRDALAERCTAKMQIAEPVHPERPSTLRAMCEEGAKRLGIDLTNRVYADRLERELMLIAEKQFEDYFYVIADIVNWAKTKMIVGPARGSSCGSLVCYLLNITAIDPIPYGLLFERFIDINRSDLPDIDIDFSDQKRHLVFERLVSLYGIDRVARLGTVAMFKPRSILQVAKRAFDIKPYRINQLNEVTILRSSGDARANATFIDTLTETKVGKDFVRDFPEVAKLGPLEGSPNVQGRHAAGVVITAQPIAKYVAIDRRSWTAQCDKKDAEDLGLLKIDALGLTQLSTFERTAELLGVPPLSGWLEKIPIDDPAAFAVLNRRHYAGVFQFNGYAVQSVAKFVEIDSIHDVQVLTAVARPGPMATGQANVWMDRKNGKEKVQYLHPLLEPALRSTLGIVVMQEQVMQIGREVGDLSWEEVTALRKAMSKSLGKEYFDRYGDPWKRGAIAKGMPSDVANKVWDQLCSMGCLSGDTVLINPHPNQNCRRKSYTLKELYDAEGYQPGNIGKVQKAKLLCMQGPTIKPASVVNVMYSGKKETWLVTTSSGEQIRATMEHRFMRPDSSFSALSELKLGDAILMKGDTSLSPTKVIRYNKRGSGAHNWWPLLKAGKPLFKRQIKKLRALYDTCQKCFKAPYEETHHKDNDHSNHDWDNLIPVCRVCHKQLHKEMSGRLPGSYTKGKMPRSAFIESISDPLIEDTYDIEMPSPYNNFVANDFIVHNSWAFNHSHSVAYGTISYWCAWLKAHHPMEFAAASLDAEGDSLRQIELLKELVEEDIAYVPIDFDNSALNWEIADNRLVGPLTLIRNIGPATALKIVNSRKPGGVALTAKLREKLENAKTAIDSLTPIADAARRLAPDLAAKKIFTPPTKIIDLVPGEPGLIIALMSRLAPRDENDPQNVAKRGYAVRGPSLSINMFFRDDSGEMFCKISRHDYERLKGQVLEKGKGVSSSIFALKGNITKGSLKMMWVTHIRYLGELDLGTSQAEMFGKAEMKHAS